MVGIIASSVPILLNNLFLSIALKGTVLIAISYALGILILGAKNTHELLHFLIKGYATWLKRLQLGS